MARSFATRALLLTVYGLCFDMCMYAMSFYYLEGWRWVLTPLLTKGCLWRCIFILTVENFRDVTVNFQMLVAWSALSVVILVAFFFARAAPMTCMLRLVMAIGLRGIDGAALVILYYCAKMNLEDRRNAHAEAHDGDRDRRMLHVSWFNDLPETHGKTRIEWDNMVCCICLAKLSPGEMIAELSCHHVAHMHCDVQWCSARPRAERRADRRDCPMRCF
eukprot:TRINITY_DN383_c0_g1_i1.p1 TRINITY_DN383_c0_g1~~TRINITY_DN383_c0_g1_i1.p1  ORF type:complete len:218 (-),score=24.18 TRINITY_DN383_c0_g1_i1:15-668(-)